MRTAQKLNLVIWGNAGTIFLLVAVLVGVSLFFTNQAKTIIAAAEQKELDAIFDNVQGQMEAQSETALLLAENIAMLPGIQQTFAERNRDNLLFRTAETFDYLSKKRGVSQFQFHLPPATSFLRVHKPEHFGDDLSAFRQTVVEANAQQKSVQGLENGVAGIGIRGVSPVRYQGQHVGTVEFGMSLGQFFFDKVKTAYGIDSFFDVITPEGTLKNFAITYKNEQGALVPADVMNDVFKNGTTRFVYAELNGKPVSILLNRITDFSAQPLGVMGLVMDHSAYAAQIKRVETIAWVLCTLSGLLGLFLLGLSLVTSKTTLRAVVRMIEDRISPVALQVGEVSEQLDTMATEIKRESDSSAHQSSEAAHMAQETSKNADAIAAAAEEMAASVNDISQQVSHASDLAKNAVQQMGEANTKMNTLSGVINEVSQVTGIITDIADQTNLLALNASIEAARAGDAGRGFAVVADEVKKLAEQTAKATSQIRQLMQSVLQSNHDVLQAINNTNSTVASVEHVSTSIAAAVEEQSVATAEITKNVSTSSVASQQVSQHIAQVNRAAEEVGSTMQQLQNIAAQMHQRASALKETVTFIMKDMR